MSTSGNLTTQDLEKADMKKLVTVLRDVSFPPPESKQLKESEARIKKSISSLPSRLRAPSTSTLSNIARGLRSTSALSSTLRSASATPGTQATEDSLLCPIHTNLNPDLISHLYGWVQYEISTGIPLFLDPLIHHGGLTIPQEVRARLLEPVAQMWDPHFRLAARHDMSQPGTMLSNETWLPKWYFQPDACLACMLARIGSDTNVLCALLAGMVARFTSRKSLEGPREFRSRRMLFVRCWIKASVPGSEGDKIVEEAWEFGREMKRIEKAWNQYRREEKRKTKLFKKQTQTQHSGAGGVVQDSNSSWDPKLGPYPRPYDIEQNTRCSEIMGRTITPVPFPKHFHHTDTNPNHDHYNPFADPVSLTAYQDSHSQPNSPTLACDDYNKRPESRYGVNRDHHNSAKVVSSVEPERYSYAARVESASRSSSASSESSDDDAEDYIYDKSNGASKSTTRSATPGAGGRRCLEDELRGAERGRDTRWGELY